MGEYRANDARRRIGGAADDLGSQAKGMARNAADAASGVVRDARRWADDHAPRRLADVERHPERCGELDGGRRTQ